MSRPARAGALIHAKDLERVSGFYRRVLDMRLQHADGEHHLIESCDMQLIVHAIPPQLAATFKIAQPPQPREEQAIKLFFTVPSLSEAVGCVATRPRPPPRIDAAVACEQRMTASRAVRRDARPDRT